MLPHIGSTTYHVQGKVLGICLTAAILSSSKPLLGDGLPDAPGKAATVRVCGRCHSPELVTSLHQTHSAWQETIVKMIKLGAQGSDEEFEAVLGYVSTHFGVETPGPININTARAVDLEAGLLLLRSEATTLVAYREKNGPFNSLDELRKVPGLDTRKIEQQKSRIVF